MLDMRQYEEAAELIKVLAHPHRLAIVHGLTTKRCNVSTMQDCLDIPQSTVSSHLKLLRAAGVVAGHRKGTEVAYTVVSAKAAEIVCTLMGCESRAGFGAAPDAREPVAEGEAQSETQCETETTRTR